MKQAISYVRFSSHRQRGGSSVERQEAMISAWLEAHPDYEISTQRFKDLARSGFKGEHIKEGGGFGDLLLAVENGVIRRGDVVLVEAMDRAGRLPALEMLTKVIAPILKAGVSIITLDDNTTYTEESANTSQIYLLVAKIQASHSYSQNLSDRVSASYKSRRNKAKEGVMPKRATPAWLTSAGVVREDVAPWIKTAFELYISGVGKNAIAKRMRDSGVERLEKCVGRTVDGWLRNQAAIGKWVTRADGSDPQVIDDVYPIIVEPSLFYKVQLKLDSGKGTRSSKTAKNFLVGLVRCGSCGKSYIIQNRNGLPHSLRCHSRASRRDCVNSHIVPKAVLDAIYSYTSVPASIEAIAQQEMGVNDKEIAVRENELRALSKKVDGLVQMVDAVGFMPELASKLKDAKAERAVIENTLVILRSTVVAPAAMGWQKIGKVWNLEKDDPQRLAAMLRGVGYAITVHPDGRILSSHSPVLYRYLGVDRRVDRYKLMQGENLLLVPKSLDGDYPYHEPFQSVEGEVVWDQEDYENLRLQYE